jgi:hypothetical protein
MTTAITGSSWSVRGSETSGGRVPLQVEQAVANRLAYLASGATHRYNPGSLVRCAGSGGQRMSNRSLASG